MDLSKKLLGQRTFNKFMKMTFYGQFVAGEDHKAIRPLIQKNQAFGVGSVLDYSVEEDISQEEAEQKEMEYESWSIHFSRSNIQNRCVQICFVSISHVSEMWTAGTGISRNHWYTDVKSVW